MIYADSEEIKMFKLTLNRDLNFNDLRFLYNYIYKRIEEQMRETYLNLVRKEQFRNFFFEDVKNLRTKKAKNKIEVRICKI